MVCMRSPQALRFDPSLPYTVQNVLTATLDATQIVLRPTKVFDANLVYPESLLRMVREAAQPEGVFWFTPVVVRDGDVHEQLVLQATAAQLQPRTNSTRDGGIGLATWVHKNVFPQELKPKATKIPVVPVVTDGTFADMAESVQQDSFTQEGGITREEFVDEISRLHMLHDTLGKNPRGAVKRHRTVARSLETTPAARRRAPDASGSPATPSAG